MKKIIDVPESQVKILNVIAAKKGTDCKNLIQEIVTKYVADKLVKDVNDKLK